MRAALARKIYYYVNRLPGIKNIYARPGSISDRVLNTLLNFNCQSQRLQLLNTVTSFETEQELILTQNLNDGYSIKLVAPKTKMEEQEEYNMEDLRHILTCASNAYRILFEEWKLCSEEIKQIIGAPDKTIKFFVKSFFGIAQACRENGSLRINIAPNIIRDSQYSGIFDLIMFHELFHLIQKGYRIRNGKSTEHFAEWYAEGMAQFSQILINPHAALIDCSPGGFIETARQLMGETNNSFHIPKGEDQEHYYINFKQYTPIHAYSLLWFMIYRYSGGIPVFKKIIDAISCAENDRFDQFRDGPFLISEVLRQNPGGHNSFAEVIWGNDSTPGLVEAMYRRDFTLFDLDFGSSLPPVKAKKLKTSSEFPVALYERLFPYGFLYYEISSQGKSVKIEVKDESAPSLGKSNLAAKIFHVDNKGNILDIKNAEINRSTFSIEQELHPSNSTNKYVLVLGNLGIDAFTNIEYWTRGGNINSYKTRGLKFKLWLTEIN